MTHQYIVGGAKDHDDLGCRVEYKLNQNPQ
jgi:hypothetical protein